MAEGIAEVLLAHRVSRTGRCACGAVLFDVSPERIAAHQAAVLAANGYGKLEDAWDEGWAHYRENFSPSDPDFGANPYRRPE